MSLCKKQWFFTRKTAKTQAKYLNRVFKGENHTVYQCMVELCGGWHITTMSKTDCRNFQRKMQQGFVTPKPYQGYDPNKK